MALQLLNARRLSILRRMPFALAWFAATATRMASASEIIGALPPAALPALKVPARPIVVLQRPDHARPVQHAKARVCDGRCGNGGCGQPGCPAYCPVRPDVFGFYGTQWRTWPGMGLVQKAGYNEAATPVAPPKSVVPSADEESPTTVEEPVAMQPDASDAKPDASDAKPERETPAAEPLPPAKPSAEEPAPAAEPPAEEPAAEKGPPAENIDNLFDEATLQRRQHERLVAAQQIALQRERARQEALRQQVLSSQPPRPMPINPMRQAPGSGVTRTSHEQPAVRPNPLR